MATFFIHNEYWDARTGADILATATEAIATFANASSVHVYTPTSLTARGDEWGECDIWWSVEANDGVSLRVITDAIREAGIRVKTAGAVSSDIAKGTYDELISAVYGDI